MGKTVSAFNAITGHNITESDGWLLMETLKNVRQWQTPNKAHKDSLLDCVAYAALKAESFYSQDQDYEWIENHAGGLPCNFNSIVEIVCRDGTKLTGCAGYFSWHIEDRNDDIISYRVVK